MFGISIQFFLVGLMGSVVGAGGVMLAMYITYRIEMKSRRKVAKELEAEFATLMNSIKGLDRGPTKGSKLH